MIDRRDFVKYTGLAPFALIPNSTFEYWSIKSSRNTPIVKIGIIGLDTSHVIAFTKTINSGHESGDLNYLGFKVIAAYPTKGSDDIAASRDRIQGFTERIQEMGVQIVEDIDKLLDLVDVVLLESVDGRRHLSEAIKIFEAGKLCFIDKPVANNLAGAIAIFELSEKYKIPIFSCSTTRFSSDNLMLAKGNSEYGSIQNAYVYGSAGKMIGHIDMAFYGIHGIEALFTLMGPGCVKVSRRNNGSSDVLIGEWEDGRIGIFNTIPEGGKSGFGGTILGSNGIKNNVKILEGYGPLLIEIIKFFKTSVPPVSKSQTIELFAFMEAADVSKDNGGVEVNLADIIDASEADAFKILQNID